GEWGRYPMESVRRVPEATTLIIDDEVPRMPKRSNGFYRGKKGDFGEKVAREFGRFAIKTPAGAALADLQIAQTPHQDGEVAPRMDPASLDPERNRRALKTLLHHLGADIAGTCEAKRYVWYSHDYRGNPIDVYHRSAAVIVIDQGFETMEGASGDDWVSGTQSFRAYVRGGQITGVVAAWLRSLGHSARSHTNADSDVIQTPLVVLAGLGEMSRIGETVLNPFLGPRSKSAVVTTDLPLAWDQPKSIGWSQASGRSVVTTADLERGPRNGLSTVSPMRDISPRPASTTSGVWITSESALVCERAEWPRLRSQAATTPVICPPRT